MELLKTLKFVRGAVANKTHDQGMKHFIIKNKHIRATNGVMSLGCPIDFDVDCAPQADMLYKAIGNCKDVVSLGMTGAGRLRVSSGKFKAFVPCYPMEDMMDPRPSGERLDLDCVALLDALDKLQGFVGTDELRPWSNGVLLREKSAYVTNNVCLAQYWLGTQMPFTMNIPSHFIREVLRIKDAPEFALGSPSSITFMYEDGRWVKSMLYDIDWPDFSRILEAPSNPVAIPKDLFTGVKTIMKFSDANKVYLRGGAVHASMEDTEGASYEVEGLAAEGCFAASMLGLLEGVAETADFGLYPEPVMFFGGRVRGAILGIRQ